MNRTLLPLLLLLLTAAAAGCYTSPPSEKPPDGPLRVERLDEALQRADQFRDQEEWDQAYRWYDHAAALDSGRTADLRIAEGKFECGRRLAVEGVGVDMFGLVPDRREGIQWLLGIARDYRFTDVAPKALYYAAVGYRLIEEPDVGVMACDRLIRDYPESEWAEAAEYERVLALLTASRALDYDGAPLGEAQWRLEMYAHLHPDGRNEAKASATLKKVRDYRAEKDYRVAKWYAFSDHDFGARYYYKQVRDRYPGTVWAKLSEDALRSMGPEPPEPEDATR